MNPSLWIGRKFRTDLGIEESLGIFDAVKDECYRVTGRLDPSWTVPAGAAAFRSTQGAATTVPPVRLVSHRLAGGGLITVAVWDGLVSYGDHSGHGGAPREMWFVPSGFDTSPIPIAGRWKMRDSSLSSIGLVESPLWGAGG